MIDTTSATWKAVAERSRARVRDINRDIVKASTPIERIPALRAARKELIDLLKLDPQFKDEME